MPAPVCTGSFANAGHPTHEVKPEVSVRVLPGIRQHHLQGHRRWVLPRVTHEDGCLADVWTAGRVATVLVPAWQLGISVSLAALSQFGQGRGLRAGSWVAGRVVGCGQGRRSRVAGRVAGRGLRAGSRVAGCGQTRRRVTRNATSSYISLKALCFPAVAGRMKSSTTSLLVGSGVSTLWAISC